MAIVLLWMAMLIMPLRIQRSPFACEDKLSASLSGKQGLPKGLQTVSRGLQAAKLQAAGLLLLCSQNKERLWNLSRKVQSSQAHAQAEGGMLQMQSLSSMIQFAIITQIHKD